MNLCLYGASSDQIAPAYLQAVEALGEKLARRGHGLVFGGGAQGLMGAAARGVSSRNGYILGVAPSFFHVDGVLYPHCSEFIYTETMRQRKQIMEDRSDAFIMTPGGIGTFEEFYEILTLRQLGRHNKPIAILNTRDYYRPLLLMQEQAMEQGFLRRECGSLCAWLDDPDTLLDYLESDAAHQLDGKLTSF
jgi:uncharacterized protein (TIGR00730 family)